MGAMVWCNNCNKVVWASDDITFPLSGVVNEMSLPCPECNRQRCFDGWNCNKDSQNYDYIQLQTFAEACHFTIVDMWSAMKFVAIRHKKEWKPSPDNRWQIGAYIGLRARIEMLKIEKSKTLDPFLINKIDGRIEELKWIMGE